MHNVRVLIGSAGFVATQHNAAMCEEMAAMGHQLTQGSNVLTEALSGFRYVDEGRLRMVS